MFTTRRAILSISAGCLATGLAGCTNGVIDDNEPNHESPVTTSNPVFKDISFAGENLIVQLQKNHNISELHLIQPDGSTFIQSKVEEATTTVQLRILSKQPNEAYTAGTYELVAVSDGSRESMMVELQPSLEVVDVEPQLTEDKLSTGKLLVTVRNNGSGPTWVYNVGYVGAPYENAPSPLSDVSATTFETPDEYRDEIIQPKETKTFLKQRGVLIVGDDDEVSCIDGKLTLTVVVQSLHGDIRQQIEIQLSGGYNIQDSASVQHPCKNINIELSGK